MSRYYSYNKSYLLYLSVSWSHKISHRLMISSSLYIRWFLLTGCNKKFIFLLTSMIIPRCLRNGPSSSPGETRFRNFAFASRPPLKRKQGDGSLLDFILFKCGGVHLFSRPPPPPLRSLQPPLSASITPSPPLSCSP